MNTLLHRNNSKKSQSFLNAALTMLLWCCIFTASFISLGRALSLQAAGSASLPSSHHQKSIQTPPNLINTGVCEKPGNACIAAYRGDK